MLIYNKYKAAIYLNMKESLNLIPENKNFFCKLRIDYVFNFKKKLLRNFLFFFFLTYTLNPFSSFNFTINPVFFLKLEVNVLCMVDNYCMDNFYNFYS